MNKALFEAVEMLEKEKGISKEYMYGKIIKALEKAFEHENNGGSNVRVVLNPEKHDLKVYRQMTVVEEVTDPRTQIALVDVKRKTKRNIVGSVIEEAVKPDEFKRLSARIGRQFIVQAIREAERELRDREYQEKKGEAVSATVDFVDPNTGNVRLNLGNFTSALAKDEQIEGETYTIGQHIKVYIHEEHLDNGNTFYKVSRRHPGLIKALFELNIPEIQDGTVIIMNVAREAGSRTKISVMSRDPDVDPIGTCVGTQNQRKSVVTGELNGEKIDIIKYSESPEEYVKAALQPATVDSVVMEGERACKVYVAADQLSLAIGKGGQNARLAANLTGIKIDIKTTE
ncbi:MAG: transcription termination/antitermination protein NusA [Clostridia bacterium]|nr:transcription termination/antitermination protein NusA [Clostridia bacterium]